MAPLVLCVRGSFRESFGSNRGIPAAHPLNLNLYTGVPSHSGRSCLIFFPCLAMKRKQRKETKENKNLAKLVHCHRLQIMV